MSGWKKPAADILTWEMRKGAMPNWISVIFTVMLLEIEVETIFIFLYLSTS